MTDKTESPRMAWYLLRTGEWVQAPYDDPRWAKGATRRHRRKSAQPS
jgi:hypothetical protein